MLVSVVSCFSVFIVRDSTDLTGDSAGDRGVTARQMGSGSAGRDEFCADAAGWKIRAGRSSDSAGNPGVFILKVRRQRGRLGAARVPTRAILTWSELDDVAFKLLESIVEALSGSVGSGRDRAALALETPSLPRGRNPESPCLWRWCGVGPL